MLEIQFLEMLRNHLGAQIQRKVAKSLRNPIVSNFQCKALEVLQNHFAPIQVKVRVKML